MVESGKIYESAIYFIQTPVSEISIGDGGITGGIIDLLTKKHGIILWENQGTFRIISPSVLKNTWQFWNAVCIMRENFSQTSGLPTIGFTWDQGIPLHPEVAAVLLASCEKGDGFRNPNPTSQAYGTAYYRDKLAPGEERDSLGDSNSAPDTPGEDQADKP